MATTTEKQQTQQRPPGFLSVPFQDIEEPGVYITQQGHMFRIPPDALAEGRSPLITWESRDEQVVTRVSQDPYAPISKCRQLAADLDLPVRF